jgi:5-methylcytosine-specific restriction protein A
MTFDRGNRTIRDHAVNGKDLLLFQALGMGKPYRYIGLLACQDCEIVQAPDRDNRHRDAIVFLLSKVYVQHADKEISQTIPNATQGQPPMTREELRRQAFLAASPGASGRSVPRRERYTNVQRPSELTS